MKHDLSVGDALWLTVVSPEDADGAEILLEPGWNPDVPAKQWKATLYGKGMPVIVLNSSDVRAEYDRLTALGVKFQGPPAPAGGVTMATFDDTCGNWVMVKGPG